MKGENGTEKREDKTRRVRLRVDACSCVILSWWSQAPKSSMIPLLLLGAFLVFVLYVFLVEPLWVVPLLEQLTPQVTYRVRTNLPLVALSFDDGPHPVFTPQVLEILQRYGARATFFLIGDRAERHPEIVRKSKPRETRQGTTTFTPGWAR